MSKFESVRAIMTTGFLMTSSMYSEPANAQTATIPIEIENVLCTDAGRTQDPNLPYIMNENGRNIVRALVAINNPAFSDGSSNIREDLVTRFNQVIESCTLTDLMAAQSFVDDIELPAGLGRMRNYLFGVLDQYFPYFEAKEKREEE